MPKMTVYVDGKEEQREIVSLAHVHHNQPPKEVPQMYPGEQMTRSITGEVHITRS